MTLIECSIAIDTESHIYWLLALLSQDKPKELKVVQFGRMH